MEPDIAQVRRASGEINISRYDPKSLHGLMVIQEGSSRRKEVGERTWSESYRRQAKEVLTAIQPIGSLCGERCYFAQTSTHSRERSGPEVFASHFRLNANGQARSAPTQYWLWLMHFVRFEAVFLCGSLHTCGQSIRLQAKPR